MRSIIIRLSALLLVFSIVCAFPVSVSAVNGEDTIQPQSSNYISTTKASIFGGNGTITVKFSIAATGKMDSLGASVIRIKDTSGNIVKTFYSSSTNGMMGYNCAFHNGSVTYNATSGQKYYAVVSFKATDSTGGDYDSYTTAYATA